jgi:hypothetical protein
MLLERNVQVPLAVILFAIAYIALDRPTCINQNFMGIILPDHKHT